MSISRQLSRRQLLGTAAASTAAAALAPAGANAAVSSRLQFGYYDLVYLDGAFAGIASRVSGGAPYGHVVAQSPTADGVISKAISSIQYEPLVVEFGTGMSAAWYDWVASAVRPGTARNRRSGAIVTTDLNGRTRRQIAFGNAYLSQIAVPVLDGATKEPLDFAVTITPESTRQSSPAATLVIDPGRKRLVSAASFRFQIDGLTIDSQVRRVHPFASVIAQGHTGRDYVDGSRVTLELPVISVSLRQSAAAQCYEWFEEFVLKRNASQKRGGMIEILDPATRTVLASVRFTNLGIFRFGDDPDVDASGERHVKVEMFCEGVQLDLRAMA